MFDTTGRRLADFRGRAAGFLHPEGIAADPKHQLLAVADLFRGRILLIPADLREAGPTITDVGMHNTTVSRESSQPGAGRAWLLKGADTLKLLAEHSSGRRHTVRIDVLVNNAGIWERGAADRMSEREWIRTIDINLNGTFRLCRLILPIMKKQRSGKIINISSTAGQRGEPFHSHYAASKGGIISFTKSIAIEAIPFGIHVNCVAPGWVSTDMTAHVSGNRALYKEICAGLPRGRFATPEEIAGPVLFLASDLAVNLVGEILNVNGGSVLCG